MNYLGCACSVHRVLEFALYDVVKVGAGTLDRFIDQGLLRFGSLLEHIRHHLCRRTRMTDAEAQAHVVRRAKFLGHIGLAVMPAIAATTLRRRALPGGISRSSCTTRISAGGIL